MSLPEPLTPLEADLRGMPFMPLDVVRLTDSDLFALSTGEEFKAALAEIRSHNDRQREWLFARCRQAAPQTLVVPS